MSRTAPLRRICPDVVKRRITEAQESQFYVVQELGPMAFILKDAVENPGAKPKKYKVGLGSYQSCNCPEFLMENDVCVHLTSLVDREINEMMNMRRVKKVLQQTGNNDAQAEPMEKVEPGHVARRPLESGDICPICLDEMTEDGGPTTYCRLSCGNNLHIKCMKILMEHQIKSLGLEKIKCPLCRDTFGHMDDLKKEFAESAQNHRRIEQLGKHYGTSCSECGSNPIIGKLHRCSACKDIPQMVHLCDTCFMNGCHSEHAFRHKTHRNSKWFPSSRTVAASITPAMAEELQQREISGDDYDVLSQLDTQTIIQQPVPLHVIAKFPTRIISKRNMISKRIHSEDDQVHMISDNGQMGSCVVCLLKYQQKAILRKLPCQHEFHQQCIDRWLLTRRPTCPSCGKSVIDTSYSMDAEDGDSQLAFAKRKKRTKAVKKNAEDNSNQVLLPSGLGPITTSSGSLRKGQLASISSLSSFSTESLLSSLEIVGNGQIIAAQPSAFIPTKWRPRREIQTGAPRFESNLIYGADLYPRFPPTNSTGRIRLPPIEAKVKKATPSPWAKKSVRNERASSMPQQIDFSDVVLRACAFTSLVALPAEPAPEPSPGPERK